MSMGDGMIMSYFTYVLDATEDELASIKNRLESGENPRDIKMELAERVVSLYHSSEAGRKRAHTSCKFSKNTPLPKKWTKFRLQMELLSSTCW